MAKLIAFFSRRDENYVSGEMKELKIGNTELAASVIKKLTGADEFQIIPVKAYSRSYNECIAEAQADQKRKARPELASWLPSIEQYDTIYLGYPNYWGTMPMAVMTFLEHYDFAGKIIKPFCTHEGSGFGGSEKDIKKLCPGALVEKGLAIRGGTAEQSVKDIQKWL